MAIYSFVEKLRKLNPEVDFSNIIERIYIMRDEFPINFYHGSYFDLTNIAILRDIVDERSCPPWLITREIQSFASQALTGIFFHTDVGHAEHGLQEMSQKEQPQMIHFCSDGSLCDYGNGNANSPFYVFKECLHNQNIMKDGATVNIQPIRIFDGSEYYLTKDNIDPIGYFPNGICISSKEPNAYLITLSFKNIHRYCSPYCFENEYLRQMREKRYTEDVFNPIYIILFNMPTHYLSRYMKENHIDVFSLYEANDADSSDTLHSSMPEPLCNAKYIMSGRGCIFESGHAEEKLRYYNENHTHIIKNAYFRFNDYSFLSMAGKLETGEKDRWGYERNDRYFHGTHSVDYIYGLPSVRLVFKKLATPMDFLAVPEIKHKYEKLKELQNERKKLESKMKSLDSQVPWLFLTEPPRIHIMHLIKNEKHRIQVDAELMRIHKQLLLHKIFHKFPSERTKCANAMRRYICLLKEKNRPQWMTEYVSYVWRIDYYDKEIESLTKFLEPLLNRLTIGN